MLIQQGIVTVIMLDSQQPLESKIIFIIEILCLLLSFLTSIYKNMNILKVARNGFYKQHTLNLEQNLKEKKSSTTIIDVLCNNITVAIIII